MTPVEIRQSWDEFFHKVCDAIGSQSSCLSRKIGAILVRDKSIISTGYNSPPRGIPHCGYSRLHHDKSLNHLLLLKETHELYTDKDLATTCPRKILGFESGEGMEYCTAQHAEENCVSNAARNGVSTIGSILYMNCVIPCHNCLGTLINAGVKEIVVDEASYYDDYTKFITENSNIKIRTFDYER